MLGDSLNRIDAASVAFTLRLAGDDTEQFFCLVTPPKDDSIFSYDLPLLAVDGYIHPESLEPYITIKSIDDYGVTIFFTNARGDVLTEFSKLIQDHRFICPNKENTDSFCRKFAGYADYW